MSNNDLIHILIPPDNKEERTYIVHSLLSDFLGLRYDLEVSSAIKDYHIKKGAKSVVIKDAFFSMFPHPLSYLNILNVPKNVAWFTHSDERVPILYGDNTLKIEGDTTYCGLDIFASSFFMLTRWEEIVIGKRDKYGRCDEPEMFVVKNNLYDRPLVNEYCSLLKGLLMSMNVCLPPVQNIFTAFLTHDIDFLFRYGSLFSLGQNLAGDIVNRKSFKTAGETILNYTRFKKGLVKDPFDTFDELMDMSELYGLKSSFFFKPALPFEKDSTYSIADKRVQSIIKHIYHRGHEVGFHPSVNTFHNEVQFKTEYERIKSAGVPIYGGRQHYLLYDISETFNFWEDSGLSYDSGLGFYQRFGFRCGICLPFRIFDIRNRKVLKLIQKPLCVMDAAMILSDPGPEQFYESILLVLNQVKKHSGLFVCLWHNDGFSRPENTKYKTVYEDILKLM